MRISRLTFLSLLGFSLYCSGGDSQPCDALIEQLGLDAELAQIVTGGKRSRTVGLVCALNSREWSKEGETLQVYHFQANAEAVSMLDDLLSSGEHHTEHFDVANEKYSIATELNDHFAICTYTSVIQSSLLFLQWIPDGKECHRSEIPKDREDIIRKFRRPQTNEEVRVSDSQSDESALWIAVQDMQRTC